MLKELITKLIILANLVNFYCSNPYQIRYSETLKDVAGKFTIECEENIEDNKYVKAAKLLEEHCKLNEGYAPVSVVLDSSKIIQYVKEIKVENYILSFYNSRNNQKSILKNIPVLLSFIGKDHLEIKITESDTSLILVEDNLNGEILGDIERSNGENIKFSNNKKYQKLFNELFDKIYKHLIKLE